MAIKLVGLLHHHHSYMLPVESFVFAEAVNGAECSYMLGS